MRRALFIGYLLVYVVSASLNYFFVKFGLRYSTPLSYMAIRYLLAGAVLAGIAFVINDGNYYFIINKDLLLLSLFSSLSTALWAYGLVFVDPGTSAVFGYTMPLFAIPLSILLIHERPRLLNVVGVLIGFVGGDYLRCFINNERHIFNRRCAYRDKCRVLGVIQHLLQKAG